MTNFFDGRKIIYLFLGLILLTHILILSKLIYFPYPELFIYPYLTNHGLKPYSQIIDQHFPGLMFLPLNLDNLGMTTPEIARIWSIMLVLATQLMLFFVGKEIFKSNTKAILVNLLYLFWQPFFEGWVLWIDSFLPVILLPAFYSFYKRWIFRTGLLLGLGIVFKQVLIPLAFFVLICFFWKDEKFKVILRYLSGLLLPIIFMVIYLLVIGVFRDFWYWTVIFNLTVFAKSGRGEIPTLAHLFRVLLVFGTPFLILRKIRLTEAQILIIFLTGALLGLSTRFDFVHFQPALPFAVLAFVYSLGSFNKSPQAYQAWSGRLKIVGIFGYFLILFWWLNIFYKGHLGNRVIAFDSQIKELAVKIKDYTTPGEKIFVFGREPHLYQMSETLPAGDVFVFQFPWFFQVAEKRILEGIIRDQPQIVISDRTTEIENQKITDFGRTIDQYINENYQKIDNVGTADILRRKS
ncbi:hypothetical protein A3D83_02475 [Candidatus Daviesbacteria bacterium RIFCSPHIGHO2_02_FULL_41_10]|uniref:Glycosyltransferase RgtA/B/C/D-like domain-containing protein n=2 Tax=Candidatus Daviesiibacteriota TaxID=1752718 RepID=A0A1F5ITL4_9BACT|nr:MAG: hypothetical protein A2871_03630 [Candidatus Daviesbacteria bacterium RIFCSPHIGHO2_01_FULL_41_23]OGE32489.1 MAG: hypothetical protein A3D83_02475 [Candidatus Daviesbacteria bacterium RIFCSPHIGHO2_02_FULL_41_10]OGE62010.1 MAG: hypothetical protein A2967_03445 [Candidatus Daviesbacteria bacterium RIFCSPLOWO2_01_FULL_41_32]